MVGSRINWPGPGVPRLWVSRQWTDSWVCWLSDWHPEASVARGMRIEPTRRRPGPVSVSASPPMFSVIVARLGNRVWRQIHESLPTALSGLTTPIICPPGAPDCKWSTSRSKPRDPTTSRRLTEGLRGPERWEIGNPPTIDRR